MNRFLLLGLSILLIGCSAGAEKLETYITEPRYFLRDPHFEEYKSERDELEHQYVTKELTYAEYKQQKKELDDEYDDEVRSREKILSDGQ